MLFHFTSLNLERFAQVVRESKIYFSRPVEFNDPFELSPYVDVDELENDDKRERWVNAYAEAIKNTQGGDVLAQARPQIEAARADVNAAREFLGGLPAALVSVIQEKYRVYCLQMWSHYGAKHKGLAFEFSSLGPFFDGAFRVNYAAAATPIDPESTDGWDLFVHGMLTKALSWQSEGEFRLVATDEKEDGFIHSNAGIASFPSDELTGIFVGCNMPDACVRAVVNEAANRDRSVPVWQMVKVPNRFALTVQRIFPKD